MEETTKQETTKKHLFESLSIGNEKTDLTNISKRYEDSIKVKAERDLEKFNVVTPTKAAKALQIIDLKATHADEDEYDIDSESVAKDMVSSIKAGSLDSQYNIVQNEEKKRTNKVLNDEITNSIEAGDTDSVMELTGYGMDHLDDADPFFDKWTAGHESKLRQQAMEDGQKVLDAIAVGLQPEYVKNLQDDLKADAAPVLGGPMDLLIDIGTGAILAKGAKLGGSTIVHATGNTMRKQITTEVIFGQLAGGFMDVANRTVDNKITELVSGLLGPVAAASLFQMTRKGFSTWLSHVHSRNPKMYRDLNKIVSKGEDTFSVITKEVMKDVEKTPLTESYRNTPDANFSFEFGKSPVAHTADIAAKYGDKGGADAVTKAVLTALGGEDSELTKLAMKATDAGPFTHTAILPHMEEISVATIPSSLESGLQTDLARFMHNSGTIREGVGNGVFHDIMSFATDAVNNIIHSRIYKDNSIYIGSNPSRSVASEASEGFHKGTVNQFIKAIFHPDRYMGDMRKALVDIPTSLNKFEKRMVKTGQAILDKNIFKGLDNYESKQLTEALMNSTDLNETLRPVRGGLADSTGNVIDASEKVINAYFNTRLLMESMYDAANKTVHQVYHAQGVRQLDSGFLVAPLGKAKKGSRLEIGSTDADGVAWTKEMQDEGWIAYRYVDTSDPNSENIVRRFLSPEEHATRIKDIDPGLRVLPYREGYFPIRYNKNKSLYTISKVTREKGEWKIERVAHAETRPEADAALKELNNAEEGQFVAHRSDEEANYTDIALGQKLSQSMRQMSPEQLAEIKQALVGSGKFKPEEIDAFVDYARTYNYQRPGHFRKRGSQRLKDAKSIIKELKAEKEKLQNLPDSASVAYDKPTLDELLKRVDDAPLEPTKAALANYLAQTSKFINHGDWNQKLQDMFVEKYSNVLVTDKGKPKWNDPIKKLATGESSAEQRALANEARVVQDQLDRVLGLPTTNRVAARDKWRTRVDKLYKSKNLKHVGKLIDKYLQDGLMYPGIDFVKKLAATTKLGLFNVSQLVVQTTVLLNSFKYAGTNPKALKDAFLDFNDAFMHHMVGTKLGLKEVKGKKYLYDLIQHSGFVTGLDYEYADKIMQGASGWLKKTKDAGFLPMKAGENMGRAICWFAERQNLISKIKSGEIKGLKIDSDEFLHRVNIASEAVAGNFTKYNKALMSRDNLVSLPTQFMTFPLFQAEFMFGKGLNFQERAGVFAAWLGAFGVSGGLPFMGDVESAIELHPELTQGQINKELSEKIGDTAKYFLKEGEYSEPVTKFLQRAIMKGGPNALTQGELDIVTRAGLANQFQRFFDGMDIRELSGPGLTTLAGLIKGVVKTPLEVVRAIEAGNLTVDSTIDILRENTKELPSINNALTSTQTPMMNKRGDVMLAEPTYTQRAMQAIGLKPGTAVELSEREWYAKKSAKVVNDHIWERAMEIAKLSVHQPDVAIKELENESRKIAKYHPFVVKKFFDRFVWALMNNGMNEEQRTIMLELRKTRAGGDTLYGEF